MQSVAQAWLVLHLTGSGVDLGIVVGLQFLPMLLLGPFGGLVADRVDKRNLLFVTQSAGGLLALVLGILVVTDTVGAVAGVPAGRACSASSTCSTTRPARRS